MPFAYQQIGGTRTAPTLVRVPVRAAMGVDALAAPKLSYAMLQHGAAAADNLIGFAVGTNAALEGASYMAKALAADIEKLRKIWPARDFVWSLTALKSFTDKIAKIPSAAVDAGIQMGNDVSNTFVSGEYFKVVSRLQASIIKWLNPIYNQAIIPAQNEAIRRGIPQSQWDEITVEVPDLKSFVFKLLNDTKGSWESYAYLEGIKPHVLRAIPQQIWEGLRAIGGVAVAIAKVTGKVINTFSDLVDAAGQTWAVVMKVAKYSAIAAAAYALYWAVGPDSRSKGSSR